MCFHNSRLMKNPAAETFQKAIPNFGISKKKQCSTSPCTNTHRRRQMVMTMGVSSRREGVSRREKFEKRERTGRGQPWPSPTQMGVTDGECLPHHIAPVPLSRV